MSKIQITYSEILREVYAVSDEVSGDLGFVPSPSTIMNRLSCEVVYDDKKYVDHCIVDDTWKEDLRKSWQETIAMLKRAGNI